MNQFPQTRVAFLGAGNIAGPYADSLKSHPELLLIGVFDLDEVRRATFARSTGCKEFASLDEMLDDAPDIVVNLTSAPFHFATTKELLERGQNVFSEKPLALSYTDARELEQLAAEREVRLACAPSLWLGAACSAATAAVQGGEIGVVRLITAEVNQGRIESWHPAPQSFYSVGPIVDVGVYPIAFLTALFGSVAQVTAVSTTALDTRVTIGGDSFSPRSPDSWIVIAEFVTGQVLRLSCNFYVDHATVPRTLDLHGDAGSLRIDDWILPGSAISIASYGRPFEPFVNGTDAPIDWCIGLAELAGAMREGRAHRAGARHAAHVVEILDAARESASSGSRVEVYSRVDASLAPAN
ncbi:hypothetical protein B7R22_02145 [Subtercola boreus]|uniref:Oxidoreductase n=1 Tax=Subtercola boreus TaxID=120213 RepID=A0A3E0W6V5_9MICO|nr:Gfo/Idh/MocA family oxidoreductase [Subtercola boreus]RFA16897.1 hypothetical protein B7R22_02145 [Subtercola boreus]